ncbi:metal-dependent transcriptional regulator [uncultured Ruminococcus sp.]|uniref:metal-dependent transcriptional regulator n=1 Tax=uncultured Ruminococcus sp. TaxID=165186 RepID=UPI0029308121|nr:metal-dependent transcriptional regulator [uncultured Ruminococcus sp.]
MKLQESGEMYLETILLLTQKKSFVRAIDVGEEMGFSKPSVSRAIGLLRNGGFVEVGDGGGLSLTETGREVAEKIYERHKYLTKMLMEMGVDEETAAEDACRMEHVVSDKSFAAIKNYFHYNEA